MSRRRAVTFIVTMAIFLGLLGLSIWLRVPGHEFDALRMGLVVGALPFVAKQMFQHAIAQQGLIARYGLGGCILALLALVAYSGVTGTLSSSLSEQDRDVFNPGVAIGIFIGAMWLAVEWIEDPKDR